MYSGALAAIAVRVSNVLFAFLGTVLFARMLSTEDFGAYAYATAALGLAAVIGVLGLDQQTSKVLAIAYKSRDWPTYWLYLDWTRNRVLVASTVVALMFSILIQYLTVDPIVKLATTVMMIGVPFLAFNRLQRGRLQATDRTTLGIALELPAVNLGLLICACGLLMAPSLQDAVTVTVLHILVLVFVVLLGNHCYTAGLAQVEKTATETTADKQSRPGWSTSMGAFAVYGVLRLGYMNGFLLLAGLLADAAATGVYAVATRISFLIFLVLSPIQLVIAAPIANAWHSGNRDVVANELRRATIMGILMGGPLILIVLGFPQFFLGLFGAEYLEGHAVLRILTIGQLAVLVFGPAQTALMMVGQEVAVSWVLALALGLGVATALFLFDHNLLLGIAIGSLVSSAAACVLLVPLCWRLFSRRPLRV